MEQGLGVSGPRADGCEPEAQAPQITHLMSSLVTSLQSVFFFPEALEYSSSSPVGWGGLLDLISGELPQPCCPGSTLPPPFLALNRKFGARDLFNGKAGDSRNQMTVSVVLLPLPTSRGPPLATRLIWKPRRRMDLWLPGS